MLSVYTGLDVLVNVHIISHWYAINMDIIVSVHIAVQSMHTDLDAIVTICKGPKNAKVLQCWKYNIVITHTHNNYHIEIRC